MTFDDIKRKMVTLGIWRAVIHEMPPGKIMVVVGSNSSKDTLEKTARHWLPVTIFLTVVVDKTIIKGRKKGVYELIIHPW